MTDCVSLFWLEISFNMHDKRRPSGTLPTNSAAFPLQTPAVSAVHRFIISGSFLTVLAGIPDWILTCAGKCAQKHSSLLKRCTKLYVLTVITATKSAHFPLLSSVLVWCLKDRQMYRVLSTERNVSEEKASSLGNHSWKAKACFQIHCQGKYLALP